LGGRSKRKLFFALIFLGGLAAVRACASTPKYESRGNTYNKQFHRVPPMLMSLLH
jgi:hypothetical protein